MAHASDLVPLHRGVIASHIGSCICHLCLHTNIFMWVDAERPSEGSFDRMQSASPWMFNRCYEPADRHGQGKTIGTPPPPRPPPGAGMALPSMDELKRAFDENNDGEVSLDELNAALQRAGGGGPGGLASGDRAAVAPRHRGGVRVRVPAPAAPGLAPPKSAPMATVPFCSSALLAEYE